MEKVEVYKKASVAGVVISVIAVMISMAAAAGQWVTNKAEVGGSAEIGIIIGAGLWYVYERIRAAIKRKKVLQIEQAEADDKAKHIKQSSLTFNTELDLRIKHIENRIYKYTLWMRSFVMHFYNGEVTLARLPIVKVILRHEVTQGHFVKKVSENFQGRPTPPMFESMIRRVISEGYYYLEDYNVLNDKDQPGNNLELFEWMMNYGAKSMFCVAIRNTITNEPEAILVMHFAAITPLNKSQIIQIKEDKKDIEHYYSEL